MSEDLKALGFIRNLANGSMVHLVYPGARLSVAFPIGHVWDMISDDEIPFHEFQENDLKSLIGTEEDIEPKV